MGFTIPAQDIVAEYLTCKARVYTAQTCVTPCTSTLIRTILGSTLVSFAISLVPTRSYAFINSAGMARTILAPYIANLHAALEAAVGRAYTNFAKVAITHAYSIAS